MYECTCGFTAGDATAFHRHLSTSSFDGAAAHRLKTPAAAGSGRYGRANGKPPTSRLASAGSGSMSDEPPAGAQRGPSWAQSLGHVTGQQRSRGGPGAQASAPRYYRADTAAEDDLLRIGRAGWGWTGSEDDAGSGDGVGPPPASRMARSASNSSNRSTAASGPWFSFPNFGGSPASGGDRPAPAGRRVGSGAAPAAPAAKQTHSRNGSLMAAMQGCGENLLFGAVGQAASSALMAAATMAAASALLPDSPRKQLRQQAGDAGSKADASAEGAWPFAWGSGAGDGGNGEGEEEDDADDADAVALLRPSPDDDPVRKSWQSMMLEEEQAAAAAAANQRPAKRRVLRGRSSKAGYAGPHGEAVRALLLWRSLGASLRALGVGLYLILLVGYLPAGLEYMQITSFLPGTAIVFLGYNLAKRPLTAGYAKVTGAPRDSVRRALARGESRVAARAGAAASAGARGLARWAAGALALAARALRGRSFTGTVWTFACLWALLLLSELRLVPQILLAMIAYASLFAVPLVRVFWS
jgi:hypothetical protein